MAAVVGTLLWVLALSLRPPKTGWWPAYSRYLKTPEWEIKRKAVIRRAGGRCEICGLRKPIQVHHLRGSYERIPNEDPWDLAALCFACHEMKHELNRQGDTLFGKRTRQHSV